MNPPFDHDELRALEWLGSHSRKFVHGVSDPKLYEPLMRLVRKGYVKRLNGPNHVAIFKRNIFAEIDIERYHRSS